MKIDQIDIDIITDVLGSIQLESSNTQKDIAESLIYEVAGFEYAKLIIKHDRPLVGKARKMAAKIKKMQAQLKKELTPLLREIEKEAHAWEASGY